MSLGLRRDKNSAVFVIVAHGVRQQIRHDLSDADAVSHNVGGGQVAVNPQSASIGERLDEGIDSPKFKVRLLPDRELVAGRSAAYYEITLLNRATSKRFTFEKERYVLVEKDFELQAMFEAFQSELLDSLPPGASHRLYVRGYASTADFTRSRRIQPTRGDLTHVSYLPASKSRGRFDGTESEQVVNGAVQNSDLPQIRAANIRALLNKGVPGAKLDIIAGALKPDTDPSVDSFDLILSVQWP